MIYYKETDANGKVTGVGTVSEPVEGLTEITESEYNAILAEIRTKADLVDAVYDGTKTLDDVPLEWRQEISERVEERKKWEAEQEATMTTEETIEAMEENYRKGVNEA